MAIIAAVLFVLALVAAHEYPWLARRFAALITRVAVWLAPDRETQRTAAWPATVRKARDDGGDGVSPALGYLCLALALRCWASRRLVATLLRTAAICGCTAAAIMAIVRPGATPSDGLPPGPLLPASFAFFCLAELLQPTMAARGGFGGRRKAVVHEVYAADTAGVTEGVGSRLGTFILGQTVLPPRRGVRHASANSGTVTYTAPRR